MVKEKKPGVKGYELEYLVSGMFQSQGYLTRRSIPLQYGSGNQDATDIDVLGILFTAPFQGHRIICDCKNKQRSRPSERIFWAKGLGEFVGSSEVYVCLPKASWEIIKFAGTGGVRVLSIDIIESYTKAGSGLYGLADTSYYTDFFSNLQGVVKSDKQSEKLWLVTRKLFLHNNPYVALNIALEAITITSNQLTITNNEISKELYAFWKYLLCELTVVVGLQLLWICSDTIGLPSWAREKHITEKLTFGDIEPSKAYTILDSAKDLANEIVKASIPPMYLPKSQIIDFGKIPPPSYTANVLGIIERALRNPEWYVSMPQLLDYLLFEQGMKKQEFTDKAYREVFGYDFADEKLKAAKNILVLLRDTCKIDWTTIWPKSGASLLKKNEEINTKLK